MEGRRAIRIVSVLAVVAAVCLVYLSWAYNAFVEGNLEFLLSEDKTDVSQFKVLVQNAANQSWVLGIVASLGIAALGGMIFFLRSLKLHQESVSEMLQPLEKLSHLTELDGLDRLKHLEEFGQSLSHLESLQQLDELELLSELKNLKDLNRLEQLSKLEALTELQNLTNLGDLDQLQNLERLDRLEELEGLANLHKLEGLESLENLERLSKLDSLKDLGELSSLNKLHELEKLNQLNEIKEALSKLDVADLESSMMAFNVLFDREMTDLKSKVDGIYEPTADGTVKSANESKNHHVNFSLVEFDQQVTVARTLCVNALLIAESQQDPKMSAFLWKLKDVLFELNQTVEVQKSEEPEMTLVS